MIWGPVTLHVKVTLIPSLTINFSGYTDALKFSEKEKKKKKVVDEILLQQLFEIKCYVKPYKMQFI